MKKKFETGEPRIINDLHAYFFSGLNTNTYEDVHKEIYKEMAKGLSLIIQQELGRFESFKDSIQKNEK